MYRTVKSLTKFGRSSKDVLKAFTPASARLSTTAQTCSAESDGEPEFLEMVKVFADNAHSLALDKLLSAKPAPGKRAEETSVREKHIRGWYITIYRSIK